MCPNFYMLYYLENIDLIEYKTCRHAWSKTSTSRGKTFIVHKKHRYFSITHRLQRLFMSLKTIEHMTWHHSHTVDEVMMHPSDGEAWKRFNKVNSYYIMESYNVSLRLYIDEFNSFKSFVTLYFCWLVIFITCYLECV